MLQSLSEKFLRRPIVSRLVNFLSQIRTAMFRLPCVSDAAQILREPFTLVIVVHAAQSQVLVALFDWGGSYYWKQTFFIGALRCFWLNIAG